MGVIHQAASTLGVPPTKYWYRIVLGSAMRGYGGGKQPQQPPPQQPQQRRGGGPDYQVLFGLFPSVSTFTSLLVCVPCLPDYLPVVSTPSFHIHTQPTYTAHPPAPLTLPKNLPNHPHARARHHLPYRRGLSQPLPPLLPRGPPFAGLSPGGGTAAGVGGGGHVLAGAEFVQDRGGAG